MSFYIVHVLFAIEHAQHLPRFRPTGIRKSFLKIGLHEKREKAAFLNHWLPDAFLSMTIFPVVRSLIPYKGLF